MDKKEYFRVYVECYEKVLDIMENIKKFIYPDDYEFNRYGNQKLSLEEKVEYIKSDLEKISFVREIGYNFSELLEVYFPSNYDELDEKYDAMTKHFCIQLEDLEDSLNNKYLPFLKKMTIIDYTQQLDKRYNDEDIWEMALKDDGIIKILDRRIDDIIWASLDTGKKEIVDDALKYAYNLSDIEFNRYISEDIESSSIIRKEKNENRIRVDFDLFDKYFEDIYGQDRALKKIEKVLKRNILFYNAEDVDENAVSKSNGPLATFMFYGPTGTGKTESAKIIADFVYGNSKQFLLLDMNSYKDPKISASALKGHPEGYVDSDKGTDFTRFLQANKKGIIVLDEFEKASNEVRELFMSMIDEGKFKDALGNEYDLSGYIFVATTNASENIGDKKNALGFANCENKDQEIKQSEGRIIDGLREIFTAPIMNRFNNLVCFNRIEYTDALAISDNLIDKLCKNFQNKKFNGKIPVITVKNKDKISKHILKECNFEKDGVRSLKNVINDEIGSEIMEQILLGNYEIVIDEKNDKINVSKAVNVRR